MLRILLISVLLMANSFVLLAQPKKGYLGENHDYKPMKINIDDSGEKYIRFITWLQMWGKYTETNPNYTDINGESVDNTTDLGIRRARILAYAQISPRFLLLMHFGINNQQVATGGLTAGTGKKPQIYFHDLWAEYRIYGDYLSMGSGLHYWHGLSRMTNASTLNFMTLDAPIFNWPNIELTDQFARQFGVYAKGKLGKLDYRVAVNKPFIAGVQPTASALPFSGNAINVQNTNFAYAGYFDYQFLDQESNKLPYKVGTYLGKKKILNIGAGFYVHPEATANIENNEVNLNDQMLFAGDLFYERPLKNDMAISIYSVFYNFDFGPNYLRNVGIMSGTGGIGGANSQPTIGTGNIWYTQVGFLTPDFNDGQHLMPFVTYTRKDFEALPEATNQFDFGVNYFINGHHSKLTLQYSTRPVPITGNTPNDIEIETLGELILQAHIFI
jgi:hypothetical protein